MTRAKVVETHESEGSVSSDEDLQDRTLSENEDTEGVANAGWADSMARILKTNKPKGKKSLVLSKAKKLTDVRAAKTKSAGFQVATAEGEFKDEKIEVEDEEEEIVQPNKKRKKDVPSIRVKPDVLEMARERTLAKIATRGVVQLFNAVKMQQKDIDKKLDQAGPLEVRKEKALKSIDKRAFLDVLMGGKSQTSEDKAPEPETKREESTWSVLRDDFMMGAKMRDWDKDVEEEMEVEREAEVESE